MEAARSGAALRSSAPLRRAGNIVEHGITEMNGNTDTSIAREGRSVLVRDRRIPYDVLVIATGATHAYFGHDEWAPFAPGLKSLEHALALRRRILLAFEKAETSDDPLERRRHGHRHVVERC